MTCLSCGRPGRRVCECCAAGMRPGPRRVVAGRVVRAAFAHHGPARVMVHRLKYGGFDTVATWAAPFLESCLPPGAQVLVPVPRARLRKARYGVDAALVLSDALGRRAALPVSRVLAPGWWWPRHAGALRPRRTPPFTMRRRVPGAVVVDDVLTTGATIAGALAALGPTAVGAVTLTGVS